MNEASAYMELLYNISGSSSKNRFGVKMLWDVRKMFILYDEPEFCSMFDYKCNIEIHLKDSLGFFQLKTHKVQSPYSFTTISRCVKNTSKSILGKLFVLKNTNSTIPNKVAVTVIEYFFSERS